METKRTIYFVLALFQLVLGNAQSNMVINPSFEDTLTCPQYFGETNKTKYWDNFGWQGTSDLYNPCSDESYCGVPLNLLGYQHAASGKTYAGLMSYSGGNNISYREYIIGRLTSTLTIGQRYYVRFNVSCADSLTPFSGFASNKLGARFRTVSTETTYPQGDMNFPFPYPDNFAHVYTNTILTDKVNWTGVYGSFVADSAYQYIIIGNFFNDAQTASYPASIPGYTQVKYAYYYIDDVCVSRSSADCITLTDLAEQKPKESLILFPNPIHAELNLVSDNGEIINTISVYDTQGNELKHFNNIEVANYKLDLSSFNSGVYILHLSINGIITHKRIVKL